LEVHLPICSQLPASGVHAIFDEDGSVVPKTPIHVIADLRRKTPKHLLRRKLVLLLFWWMEECWINLLNWKILMLLREMLGRGGQVIHDCVVLQCERFGRCFKAK